MGQKYTHKSRAEYKHFSSHSSANCKAENIGVDFNNIPKMGCCCQQSTFGRFYSKELEYTDKNNTVAETILDCFKT